MSNTTPHTPVLGLKKYTVSVSRGGAKSLRTTMAREKTIKCGVRWSLKTRQELGGDCPLLGDRQGREKTGQNLRQS